MSSAAPPLLEIPKLTKTNYAVWSPLMKNLLKLHLLWGLVDGREPAPTATTPPDEAEHYHLRRDLATSQIFLHCDATVQAQISDLEDPRELWRFLRDQSDRAAMVDEFFLRKRLYNVDLGECGGVAAYVGAIQDTINLIEACNPREPVGPAQHCFVLCDGLPDEWLPFIGELHRSGKTCRRPEELIKLFLEHEAELNRRREPEPVPVPVPVPEVQLPPPPPPPPPPAQAVREEAEPVTLVRSRGRFHSLADTSVSFYYTHPQSSVHFRACYGVPAASVVTGHIHVLYPELCRLIYINDRRSAFIAGKQQVGDVALYIRPTAAAAAAAGDDDEEGEEEAPVCGGGAGGESRRLVDWLLETPDWRQVLLDRLWEFPGGEGPSYVLEVRYEEAHRMAVYFDREREFESLGVSLEMFFPPEADAEL